MFSSSCADGNDDAAGLGLPCEPDPGINRNIHATLKNKAAGRNMIDRRLRHGGSGHGEIIRCWERYRVSATVQRNSLIKLDVAAAG